LRQASRRRAGRGPRFEHQILPSIGLVQLQHVEAGLTEQAGQRTAREIGAVLVIDVPEHAVLQHSFHVRQLEEYVDVASIADRLAHQSDELAYRADVLEGVAAANVVRLQVGVAWPVEVAQEADAGACRALGAFRSIAGVEPDTVAPGALAQGDEELSLAAADLQNRDPGADAVLGDLIVAHVVHETHEPRRERLGLLVSRRILVQAHIEADVGNESAVTAERELDVAARKCKRRIARRQHEATVSRDVVELIEGLQVAPATSRTRQRLTGQELGDHRESELRGAAGAQGAQFEAVFLCHRMDGRGTGTMKRPPWRRYSSCWVMISSLKFQGR